MFQRRHYKRISKRIFIKCMNEALEFEGVTLDICPGGVFVITDQLLPPKSVLDIECWLDEDTPLHCRGEVTWVNRGQVIHYPAGFGLQFLGLSRSGMERLQQFCTEIDQDSLVIPW